MMVVVSKSVFAKMENAEGETPALGDVLKHRRYESRHRSLDAQAEDELGRRVHRECRHLTDRQARDFLIDDGSGERARLIADAASYVVKQDVFGQVYALADSGLP